MQGGLTLREVLAATHPARYDVTHRAMLAPQRTGLNGADLSFAAPAPGDQPGREWREALAEEEAAERYGGMSVAVLAVLDRMKTISPEAALSAKDIRQELHSGRYPVFARAGGDWRAAGGPHAALNQCVQLGGLTQ